MLRKTLGLLSLGARSTQLYNEQIQALDKTGEIEIVAYSMDFDRLNQYLPDQFQILKPLLSEALLELSECDGVLIPNVTLHETVDQLLRDAVLPQIVPTNLVHMIDETVLALKMKNIKQVSVLGSAYTTHSPYWQTVLAQAGIEKHAVNPAVTDLVDVFRKKVYIGQETAKDVDVFHSTLMSLSSDCPVIIACTELSIYAPKPHPALFDTVQIHVKAGLNSLLKHRH